MSASWVRKINVVEGGGTQKAGSGGLKVEANKKEGW